MKAENYQMNEQTSKSKQCKKFKNKKNSSFLNKILYFI